MKSEESELWAYQIFKNKCVCGLAIGMVREIDVDDYLF
jgi:hypothetical protein